VSRTLAVALVHFPVLHRDGSVITSTVTNLDVHDMSRSARTYGATKLFVVHPIAAQRTLIERIKGHWTGTGAGAKRIPDRSDALDRVEIVPTLDDAVRALGDSPELWTTASRANGEVVSYADARARLAASGPPVLLVFGTAWGLAPEILARATVRLAPIDGVDGWNHLSVRAACAISLDRLRGSLTPSRALRGTRRARSAPLSTSPPASRAARRTSRGRPRT
jgi:hypothetical protein